MADQSRSFGSSMPETTDLVGEGPTNFSDLAEDVSQRLTLDHFMDGVLTDGAANQDGRHRQVTMKEVASAPIAKADAGILYSKESDSITELFYKDDATAGNEIQITKAGSVNYTPYSPPDGLTDFFGIFDGFTLLTGTTGSNGVININYPSGYTQLNTFLIHSMDYNNNSVWQKLASGGFWAYSTYMQYVNSSGGGAFQYRILIGKLL